MPSRHGLLLKKDSNLLTLSVAFSTNCHGASSNPNHPLRYHIIISTRQHLLLHHKTVSSPRWDWYYMINNGTSMAIHQHHISPLYLTTQRPNRNDLTTYRSVPPSFTTSVLSSVLVSVIYMHLAGEHHRGNGSERKNLNTAALVIKCSSYWSRRYSTVHIYFVSMFCFWIRYAAEYEFGVHVVV